MLKSIMPSYDKHRVIGHCQILEDVLTLCKVGATYIGWSAKMDLIQDMMYQLNYCHWCSILQSFLLYHLNHTLWRKRSALLNNVIFVHDNNAKNNIVACVQKNEWEILKHSLCQSMRLRFHSRKKPWRGKQFANGEDCLAA